MNCAVCRDKEPPAKTGRLVIDSRNLGNNVVRRRICPICGSKFTTFERTLSVEEELRILVGQQLRDDMRRINKKGYAFNERYGSGDEWSEPVWDKLPDDLKS